MTTLRIRSSVILLAIVAAGCARHSGDIASLSVGSLPAFETRREIATGSATHADYRVADFDGDGSLDMAVISLTGELRVLLGNGADFAAGQQVQLDGLPVWMDGGDFDGDGDEDLVVVRSDANETNIWLNDGSGSFSQAGTMTAGAGALAVAVGDLDGDGVLDVAVSRPIAPEVVVGYGDGAGGYAGQDQFSLPGGGTAFNLAIGDANHDGVTDLVVCDTSFSRLVLFTGQAETLGGAPICELQVPGTPGAVAFGDLSGDGVDDLVVSAFAADRYVVITSVQPPAQAVGGVAPCTYTSFDVMLPGRPSLARIADVTGDGINDLVACLAFQATMCIGEGLPGGGVGELTLLDATGMPLRPFVGDFDQNGRNDVCALSGNGNRVNLWLARDSGVLAGARNYTSGLASASWIEGGDFDGDGDVEVLAAGDNDTSIAILGGAGELLVEATIPVGLGVHQLEAGDLDLDGDLDVIIGVPGGVKLLRNTSTPGSYSFDVLPITATTIGSGNYPFGITIGDFDRDADMDFAICDYDGGGLHIVPGTSAPFVFDPEIIINLGGGPVDVVAADFTGDGLQDLAVSRANQSDIVVLRNEGGLDFVQSLQVPVGQSPNYLVTADFNFDGRSDLVVSNAGSGTVSVLFGSAAGFIGNDYVAGAAPTALLARDLTGDGIEDILVASLQTGDFRVLVGDGTGGFPLLPSFPGTLGASDAVLQDMTGDGQPELLISSLITERISLVRNVRE
ncbi:MAG TPA: VCBS repeat-containing protein [bacterium]|nr:VCBS repeat-containing protein [bacterium]